MATPENGSMNEMERENEPIANEWESDINEVPENEDIANEGESGTNEGLSDHDFIVNEVTSSLSNARLETDSATNGVALSWTGLLSLPTEIRVRVFRFLFLDELPANHVWSEIAQVPFPPVLNASMQLRREALQALYDENIFFVGFLHPRLSEVPYVLPSDTISSLHFNVRLNDKSPAYCNKLIFITAILQYGSPDIIRGMLSIIFQVHPNDEHIAWFTRSLARFTNFRTIQLEFWPFERSANSRCLELIREHEEILASSLGPARILTGGYGMVFHPQRHVNSLPPVIEVDWTEFLTGTRLIFNDPPMEVIEAESSGQNSSTEDQLDEPEPSGQNSTSQDTSPQPRPSGKTSTKKLPNQNTQELGRTRTRCWWRCWL